MKQTFKKLIAVSAVLAAVLLVGGFLVANYGFFGGGTNAPSVPEDTMTRGLVGYWEFDEGTGQTAYDISGNSNNGTLGADANAGADDPKWGTGKNGGGMEFDGVDDYVEMANESNFDFERTDNFSISIWLRADSNDTSIQIPFSKVSDYSPYNGLHFVTNYGNGTNDAGKISMHLVNSWGSNQIFVYTTNDCNINDGNWHHYAIAYNGSSSASGVSIYEDGIPLALTTKYDTLSATILNNVPVTIGSREDGSPQWHEVFNGSIDSVRVYNRVLTADEVRYHYNRGGPVGYWNFDEGSGTTIHDSSGNLHHGTLNE